MKRFQENIWGKFIHLKKLLSPSVPTNVAWRCMSLIVVASTCIGTSLRADQTREGLLDNGFETVTGRSYWQKGYYVGGATTSADFFQGTSAYEGNWYAYLGDLGAGYYNADGYMYQYLNPRPEADATYIEVTYYINVTSAEGTANVYDTMTVALRFFDDNLNFLQDVPLFSHDNRTQDALGVYRRKRVKVDLGSLAGRWVAVIFKAKTDSSNRTTFRIDNISAIVGKPDAQYTVTPSAGTGGSISPSSAQLVNANGSINFTATPNTTNVVNQWSVGGIVRQTGGTTFSINSVTSNTAVNVTFKVKTYTLNISSANGSISIDPQLTEYPHGGEITLTANPDSGYFLCDWTGDAAGVGNSLRFRITKNTTIQALFRPFSAPISLKMAQSTPTLHQVTIPPAPEMLHLFQCSDDWYCWRNLKVLDGNQTNIVNFNTTTTNPLEVFRTEVVAKVNTPRFLSFPVQNRTSRNTEVSSFFDHANPSAQDGIITSYRGETVKINSRPGWRYVKGGPNQPVNNILGSPNYYKNFSIIGIERDPGKIMPLIFTYPDSSIFWYDGHTGYDYVVGTDENVIAAAGGVIEPTDSSDCYNSICIDHENGYRTYYLHLSERAPNLMVNGVLQKVRVEAGQYIGRPGDRACDGDVGVHLHFGVKQKNIQNEWIRVDPYGKRAENGDVIYEELWIQGQ